MSECIFCGGQLNNGEKCVWCGFSQKEENTIPGTLSYGTKVGDYTIGGVASVDGESATYHSFDRKTQKRVIIKEFLPVTLVAPREGNCVSVQSSKQVLFKNLLMDFTELYNTLKKLKSPAMPKIYDIFSENGTAYAVMQDVKGAPLSKVLIKRGKPYSFKEIRWLLNDLFMLEKELAGFNIHHGGISDETVVVTAENTVMLTGFAIQDLRTKNEHIAYKLFDGFSAPEQYHSDKFQGSYTDIYAIAALIYYAVTGRYIDKEAVNSKEIYRHFPKYAVEALKYATKEAVGERIDDISDFVLMLDDKGTVVKPAAKKLEAENKRKVQYIVLGVVAAVVLLLAFRSITGQQPQSSSESVSQSQSQSQQRVEKIVPNLINKDYAAVIADSNYQADYVFVKLESYSDEYAEGKICAQSPVAGETIVPGSTVYLTVSLGQRTAYVPQGLIGISYNDATKILDEEGIQYRKEYVDQTREYVYGTVAGLSIGEGKAISLKDDVLILYVSNDKPFDDSSKPQE